MELGKKQSGDKTTLGYSLLFDHDDTDVIYARKFKYADKKTASIDTAEKEVFLEYRNKYPCYTFLNKNIKNWT
jgi:hypothetical protein